MKNHPWKGRGQGHLTRLKFYIPWNITGTAKVRDFKFCSRVGLVIIDCPASGRGQSHVINCCILDLEDLATASLRCIGVINKLVDDQFGDYTSYGRARRGWMLKFIIHWSAVAV